MLEVSLGVRKCFFDIQGSIVASCLSQNETTPLILQIFRLSLTRPRRSPTGVRISIEPVHTVSRSCQDIMPCKAGNLLQDIAVEADQSIQQVRSSTLRRRASDILSCMSINSSSNTLSLQLEQHGQETAQYISSVSATRPTNT